MILATFPGQGSQHVGMGKDLYDNVQVARRVFEEADDTLSIGLSKIIFFGTEEELSNTINAQPALLVTSIAILKALEDKLERKISEAVHLFAGHSMGQYTALCAADSISFAEAILLVKARASLMSCAQEGSMLACINVPLEIIVTTLKDASQYGTCSVANYNSQTQTILSGRKEAISFVASHLKALGYKSVILNVSGAFHSPLMQDAALAFRTHLDKVTFKNPKISILDNLSGDVLDFNLIREKLVLQITNPVKWMQGIDHFLELAQKNCMHANKSKNSKEYLPTLIEIGPKNVLTSLAKRDNKPLNFYNFTDNASIESFSTFI